MKRIESIDDIKAYMNNPKKMCTKKKTCPFLVVGISLLVSLLVAAVAYMAYKYKKDQSYFDDYEDFDLDDDVLYAKESDFDE